MVSVIWTVWVVLCGLIPSAQGSVVAGVVPDEQRLYRDLMWGYESSVRPIVNASQAIHITFSISINQIVDLDERKQVLTTNVFINQEWLDENLKWNITTYNGIRTLRVPATQVWLPDTFIFNNADDGSTGFMQGVYVLLSANGTVLWPVPVKLKSSCKVDITYFPFDDQRCMLRFGSWIYSGEWLTFSSSLESLELVNYMDNSEWELIAVFYEQSERTYACCPESHPDISFILHMRRRTFYYIFNIIVPCIMLSVLTLLTFWIPMTSGEKVSLGLSVFLAFSMFMLLIAEEVPATSESVPLIGIYLTTVMTMTSVSVIMAVMVINLYERGSKARRPPGWVKVVVLRWVCALLRMTHDIERLAQSIRLDDEEEKRYYCPLHSVKSGKRSRKNSYLPNDNVVMTGANRVTPESNVLPNDSDVGELSKRFSLIEAESTSANLRTPASSRYFAATNTLLPPTAARTELLTPETALLTPGVTVQSGDDSTTELEEEEPIWQRREPSRHRTDKQSGKNSHTKFTRIPTTEEDTDNERPTRWPVNNKNSVNWSSDNHQDNKEAGGEKSTKRGKKEARTKHKQETLANLVVHVCRREKALMNRKEIVVEWQTIATVLDRLMFWVFLTATLVCYIIILFVIPSMKPHSQAHVEQTRILRRD